MNKRDFISEVAQESGYHRADVEAIFNAFQDCITDLVASGEPVVLTGFAKFVRVDRPERMARNPQTGEPVKVPPTKKVKITPLKHFKEAVLDG